MRTDPTERRDNLEKMPPKRPVLVIRENLEKTVTLVTREPRELKDPEEKREIRGLLETKVPLERLVLRESLERMVPKDLMVLRETRESLV